MWKDAMMEEINSLQKNDTWKLLELPNRKKAISYKWIFAKKQGCLDGDIVCYKARLIAKGYVQWEDIDCNEVLSSIVKHSAIQILLALVAQYELKLDQLDVKTAFLHSDLEEEIYMSQSMGFKMQTEEITVWIK